MKLGLGNTLLLSPVNSVPPLSERPTFGISFDRSRYTNDAGFANQSSVGSSSFNLLAYNGPDPIFTRASAATFRGSNGLIQYAPENLLQRSEEFNDSYWTKEGLNTTGTPSWVNIAVAPNGTQTAERLIEQSASSQHSVYRLTSADFSTFSVYVKTNGRQFISLRLLDSGGKYISIGFDLVSFSITRTTNVGGTYTHINSDCQNVGNGWARCSVTSSRSLGNTYFCIDINTVANPSLGANGDQVYTGDGTSGIYVWGAQLERSSTARPYISTTTTARYGPRFEYDLNGNPLGLLMEEQSENLLQYSEQFDNAYWTKGGLNTTGTPAWVNVAIAPNGTQTADKLIENTSNTSHVLNRVISVTSGTYTTASAYVKAAGRTRFIFGAYSSPIAYRGFDLSNGTTFSVPGTIDPNSYSIEPVGDGWYRVSVSTLITATGSRTIELALISTGTTTGYAGDGVSGILIWGAQLEQKPFATSYIPTVGGSATRSADTLSMPVGTWYNTSVGTIVFEGDRATTATNNAQGYDSFFSFYSNLAAYNVLSHLGASDYEQFEAGLSGFTSSAYTYVGTEIAPNTPIKFALTYDGPASAFYAAVNGFSPATTSGADPLEVPDTLRFGNIAGNSVLFGMLTASYFNGHIKSFSYTAKYWPDDIQALTA